MVNLYEKHRWHLDPNRPPMTTPEVVTLQRGPSSNQILVAVVHTATDARVLRSTFAPVE